MCQVHLIIIQFWSVFNPVNGGGRIYPTFAAICPTPTLHLAQFVFLQINTLALLLHLSLPCLLWSSSSPLALHFKHQVNAFLKTCLSSLLNTCLYHLTPFAFAI